MENKKLIALSKRLDEIEKRVDSAAFLKEILDSIKNIELCSNCKIVVMVTVGKHKWVRKGFYQYGGIDGKIASWCSKKCEDEHRIKRNS